jgi:hypothetical protein
MRFARADSVPRINADGPLAALGTWAVKHPSATETPVTANAHWYR